MNPLIMSADDLVRNYKPRDEIEAHILTALGTLHNDVEALRVSLYDADLPTEPSELDVKLKSLFDKVDNAEKLDAVLGKLALPSEPDELSTLLEAIDGKANKYDELRLAFIALKLVVDNSGVEI